jgi:hypothetical protein
MPGRRITGTLVAGLVLAASGIAWAGQPPPASASGSGASGSGAAGARALPAALHVAGTAVVLPHATLTSAFTQAPDGAVYYSAGRRIYLAGTPAAKVVARGTVLALGATAAGLFAAVGKTVTEYRRTSGATVAAWTLRASYRKLAWAGLYPAGSRVWAITDDNCDTCGLEYGNVYWFSTSAAVVHRVGTGTAYPDFAAATRSGLYYQASTSAGSYLVRARPDGAARRAANSYLFGPLAVSGRTVALLLHHFGKHAGQYLYGYRATSLQRIFTRHVPGSERDIAGTSAGLVALLAGCASYSCPTAKVSLLAAASGATISTVAVPDALSLLAGPSAVVLTYSGGTFRMERLAA